MDKITHEVRLAKWTDVIRQCQDRPQGTTTKQWCEENNVPIKSYYYWLRRVRKNTYDQVKTPSNLPVAENNTGVTFSELPYSIATKEKASPYQQSVNSSIMNFHPDVVIHTPLMEIGFFNSATDALVSKVMEELRHA